MTACSVKMPPEGREVLVRIGHRFAVAYWLNVGGKPMWLPGAAIDMSAGCLLKGVPSEWHYLPARLDAESSPSHFSWPEQSAIACFALRKRLA